MLTGQVATEVVRNLNYSVLIWNVPVTKFLFIVCACVGTGHGGGAVAAVTSSAAFNHLILRQQRANIFRLLYDQP